MDIIFALAVTDTGIHVKDEAVTLMKGIKRVLTVPIVHDQVPSTVEELNEMRKSLHDRIDGVMDLAQRTLFAEKEEKKTAKVFNCFGDDPEMVEVEY